MTPPPNSLQSDPSVVAFLARYARTGAQLVPLAGDASARRYARLEGASQLLMEDRSDPVGFAGFVRLARHLNALGLSAPQVFGADPAVGLALIEDFGTTTYSAQLAEGHDETALYELAIDALSHLHHHPDAVAVTAPTYGLDTLLDEVSVFSNWFVPAFDPKVDIAAFDREFRRLWRQALASLAAGQQTLVLRDFHVDNLIELEGRSGVQRCGLLDFQDGVIGPAEYDLVSLLQDARRDLADGLEADMLARYLATSPTVAGSAADITHRYHLLGAQRHTRIAGVFLRLNHRDKKPGYLPFMPRVLRQMQTALADAKLDEITDFLDGTLPGWRDVYPDNAKTDD